MAGVGVVAFVELYQDSAGQWRFRAKARNGEVVAPSEAYANASNARRGARRLFGRDIEIRRL